MSSNQRITRSEHVASLTLPPGRLVELFGTLRRPDVLIRIAICFTAAVLMWLITGGWTPPFGYRVGYTPRRDIAAMVAFSIPDPQGTEELRAKVRSEVKCTYVHDDQALKELRSRLKSGVFAVLGAKSYEELDKAIWNKFLVEPEKDESRQEPVLDGAAAFASLRAALADDSDLTRFTRCIQQVFQQFEENGLLASPEHLPEDGSQISIKVYPLGKPSFVQVVDLKDVRIAEVTANIEAQLAEEFKQAEYAAEHIGVMARLVKDWIFATGLPTTLTFDANATRREYDELLPTISVQHTFMPGDRLVQGGQPITPEKLDVLRREHVAFVERMSATGKLAHSIADFGMYASLYVLCGFFIHTHQRNILIDLRRLTTLLAAVVLTVALTRLCTGELWQAEVVPIVLFGMTVAIAYTRELSLLLSFAVALVVCVALGMGLAEFVLMVATASVAILFLNRVRSRTKLIYVGLGAGLAAILATVGIGTLIGQPLGSWSGTGLFAFEDVTNPGASFVSHLLSGAIWHGFCALLAALIMTGLLPFIERIFDVQTDISLLELGDAAHPLLQELARCAPGTYNHSINVASLAEAAAKEIGANGLLVRVGAYFHDIGKLFKPGYFVENQGREANRHESLLPAMSTLVIIAHVKDGADLARQNRLPQTIIDFIEQHHGTTLVEYFYRQAAKQSEDDPDKEEVEESSYRYPGPKPQTREAGVLMLADAVESAGRTLVDPTPARIESLVEEIAMKRLLDGQFDDCGITLRELSAIQDSLIKSVTAVYHARVKYPDQSTA